MENERTQSSGPQQEEWFLAQLEAPAIQTDSLLAFLESVRLEDEPRADTWAQLLQEALVEHRALDEALRVLHVRSLWPGAVAREPGEWQREALAVLETESGATALVAAAGFETVRPLEECFRRLFLLRSLKPGALCLDKTWGFGVVRRVDLFYSRVDIDFEKKKDHFLSLAYAAEALERPGDDHLLVRWHRDPPALKTLVREQPAEVARLALRSYGPLTPPQLQEKLVPRLLAAEEWKKFWDAARAELKKDPLVEVPAKRTEPLRLLDKPPAFDADWLAALAAQRDMPALIAEVERYLRENADAEPPAGRDAVARVMAERLAFVIKGAGHRHPDLTVAAVLAADRLGLSHEAVDARRYAGDWLQDEAFIEISRGLPARHVGPFLDLLERADAGAARELWRRTLNKMSFTALTEVMSRLMAVEGGEESCAQALRELLAFRLAEVEVLYWLTRNMDKVEGWRLASLPDVVDQILDNLERDYNGERLKVKNQLRARFEQREWLQPVLAELDENKRREILQRVRESSGWSSLDRQSLMGQMVKLHPELENVLSGHTAAPADDAVAPGAVTSWRSYRARQAQLEKLINVDIPQNSRDIAHARSYGDLRENFEYKAAKEMQGILMRRRAEWEVMLRRVRPADITERTDGKAGLGAGISLEYADGRVERYFILGEWDQDEGRHIISSETRMAKAVEGRSAGEVVTVPTEQGETTCKLVEVTGLSPEVKAWLAAGEGG